MPLLRAQILIPADTAIPNDVCVNTFSFTAPARDQATIDSIKARLIAVYNSWANWRGPSQTWDATRIKLYDLEDPTPRPPLRDELLGTSSSAGSANCPAEVALCVSFQAPTVAGQLQARRRGRVYLGPLALVAINGSTGRPDTSFRAAVRTGFAAFLAANDALATWVVVSQFPVEGQAFPTSRHTITNGWIDNAFDTQRRRGPAPTDRVVFPP